MEINKKEIKNKIDELFNKNEINKVIISNPIKKDQRYKRIVMENKGDFFMENAYTKTHSFTDKILPSKIGDKIAQHMQDFKQCNLFTSQFEFSIKNSKRGKIFCVQNNLQQKVKISHQHNRIKNYILEEGSVVPALVDMGIYTVDGKVVKSMYSKYRQINRFLELIDDYVKKSPVQKMNIVDFGCGKSYLTFVVYHYLKFIRGIDVTMVGLDLNTDVIQKCNCAASKYGYDSLHFELGDISSYSPQKDIDIIISLHACDTATDLAIYNAIKWRVKQIFVVPCCHHEVNQQIVSNELPIITRYGLVKERISSDFTDIVRCNLLRAMSYNVDMIEFVGLEHTPKNILIRANLTKISLSIRKKYLHEVIDLQNFFGFKQTLYTAVKDLLPKID